MAKAIAQFFCEARKKTTTSGNKGQGEPYRAETIKVMYSGLNRYLVSINPAINIWKLTEFAKCRSIVSGLIRNLRKKETAAKNTADEISPEQETKLWEMERLGLSTPKALLNTLLFFSGIDQYFYNV